MKTTGCAFHNSTIETYSQLFNLPTILKKALKLKGIILGLLLLGIAVVSSVAVHKLRHKQLVEITEVNETP